MNEITITTWNRKDTLTLKENSIVLDWLKIERVIPISQIVSVEVKDPKSKMRPGMITFKLSGAPSTMIHLTSFLSIGDSANIEFPHAYECLEDAHRIQEYIANYSHVQTHAHLEQTVSAADEIRKMKSLMDEGIISQDEFEAKKRQLLGL